MKNNMKKWLIILLVLILSLVSLGIGVKDFSFLGLLKGQEQDLFTLMISRLPRLLSVLIAGAGLSISGLIMQSITGNKFVSPSTAGTMEWCRLGVLFSMLLLPGKQMFTKMTLAFFVSLIGTMLFMQILKRIKMQDTIMAPLIGMMLGSVVSSIATFIAYKYDLVQNMSSWLQGNFSLIIKGRYELLYIGIPLVILAYWYSDKFTIAGMGEHFAVSLGLGYKSIVSLGLIIVAFLTSLIVVSVGSIPFVGLIIPNLISMKRGENIKNTLFETAMTGAVFVLICDIIGRLIIFPYEVSVSVIIGILGSLIFLRILWKKKGGML